MMYNWNIHIEYGGIPCVHNVLFYVPLCYLLFSMTDLYRGQICRGVSKFDSALWEINSVVLILSARLHQLCMRTSKVPFFEKVLFLSVF